MSTTLNELLGVELLQHNESDQQTKTISTNELQGKTVAIYFSYVTSKQFPSSIDFD